MDTLTVWDHAFALLSGIVLPFCLALLQSRSRLSGEKIVFDRARKIAVYWSNSVILWILAGATIGIWCLGDRTMRELGLLAPPAQLPLGLALAALFLIAYAVDTWLQLATPQRLADTRARWRRDTPFMPGDGSEVVQSLVLVASAALCEEIVYRGFLIAYCAQLTGPTLLGQCLAIALPAAVFAACHFYQGLRAVVKILFLAGLFGAILVVTGSLWIPIVLHFVVDLVGSLLGPVLLGPDTPDARSASS